MKIAPTVGRIVHFFAAGCIQEQAAIVCGVNADGTVNLGVFSHQGGLSDAQSVPLIQEPPGAPLPLDYGHCRWMPYQLGQAERTKQAEAVLGKHPLGLGEATVREVENKSDFSPFLGNHKPIDPTAIGEGSTKTIDLPPDTVSYDVKDRTLVDEPMHNAKFTNVDFDPTQPQD